MKTHLKIRNLEKELGITFTDGNAIDLGGVGSETRGYGRCVDSE